MAGPIFLKIIKKTERKEREKEILEQCTVTHPMTAAMAKVMPGARLVVALAMDGEARWRP
jgi:hypothetical protein